MDRTAWIAITLCVIGWFLWEAYMVKQRAKRPAPATGTPATLQSPTPAAAASAPAPLASPSPIASPQATPTIPAFQEVTDTLRNSDVELHLTNRGGGIAKAVLLNHIAEGDKRVTLNSEDRTPIGAIIDNPAVPILPEYKMTREANAVQFEHTTPDRVTIRKKFFFPKSNETKDNFIAELDVDLQNGGTSPYKNPGYFVGLGVVAQLHPNDYPYFTRLAWCIDGSAKGVDIGWFAGSGGFLGLGAHAPRSIYQENLKAGAEWVAVSNQFFTTIITPLTGKANAAWGRSFEVPLHDKKLSGIEGAMGMPGLQLEPGQTNTLRFQIWAGPKLYHRLARLEHNEAEVMDFGMFKIICQLLLNFMNLLNSWLGNYAASILALTTIVKAVLWPIQNKANYSMRKMAALSPKMQELREKYKDDPTKMNQEVMKLYKQYGVNPVGGCLPMLIQIPIFFGLFTMLGQAVELRNARFLWVKDLSQPDTIGYLPILGWPINILPLFMALTSLWLMAMTPKTGDPTQRRVMMFTPLIFLFFCYNFAAALALYYTAQNLLTILQFYQNRNKPMPTLEKVAPAGKASRKKG